MDPAGDPVAWAEAARARHFAVELAGVFWIAAELGILFLVRWGRAHLATDPHAARLQFTAPLRRELAAYTLVAALLAGAVVYRYLAADAAGIVASVDTAFRFEQTHLLFWAAFVAAWVGLEGAIVYHGARGYQRLATLLPPPPRAATPKTAVALLAIALSSLVASAATVAPMDLAALDSALAPWRNSLYFFLRVAGVLWIAIEWVAALVLWRAYRRIAHAARVRP
jgi:hypothetical protein